MVRCSRIEFDRDARGRISYEYDTAGDLISVTNREGATTRFEYSSDREHYLETIVDPLGREVAKTEYDENGRLDTIFDAFGNPIDFDYDPDNNVETVTTVLDESGATATTVFEYDERGNTVRQRNADGGEIVRTFDAENNVLSETDALGETTTYTYDSNNNQLSETDPNGNTTFFTYSAGNDITEIVDPLGNTTSFSYAGQGRLTGMVDPLGRETTVDLDGRGLMEQLVNEASLSTSTTSYTYDARGYALTQTDSLGVTTTFTRDNLGRALTSSVTVTTPNGPEVLTTSYTYDDEGRQTSITNPEGETRFTEYDDLGREVATIDARGIRTEHEYNDRGEKTAIRYADGTSELFTYDRAGRQTSMTDRAGRTTVYRYDEMDRRIEAIMPDLTPGDLSDNPRMLMEYNLRGEMTAEIDPNGNRTEYTYDPAGNRIAVNRITADSLTHETQFIYDAADRQVEVIDELGRSTVTTYDAAGRQQTTTFADGSQTETVYIQSEGARIVIDENGNATRHEFDGEGRLIAVEDALSQRTEYTYDERGRMVAQTDAEGRITRYEYDGADRRTAVILPLGQRSESTYDEAGNLLVETNFNGDTIAYEYQQFNNWVDTKTITVDGAVEEIVAYQYTPVGLVSQIDDELGTTVYNYDAQDRMLSRIDPDSASISYTYDLAGNRTSVTSASGTTTYVFDDLNRLIEVSDPDVGATIYSYDLIGNLTQTELPNGVIETREYDDRYRLTLIDTENSSGTTLARYEYERDAVGNIVRTTEDGGDRVVEYDYDVLDRLTRESIADVEEGDRDISYTYDAVGNRQERNDTGEGITIYIYDDNDRLLTETLNGITTTYTYDEQGQTTQKSSSNGDETNYTWNGESQLIAVEVATNSNMLTEVYQYNDQGIRVKKDAPQGALSYLIDYNGRIDVMGLKLVGPFAQVREERNEQKLLQSKFLHGLGASPIVMIQGDAAFYYHGDQVDSIRSLTNDYGDLKNTYIYDAFGRVLSKMEPIQNPYLFAGEEYNNETKTVYLRARFLDSESGRFISKDQFGGFLDTPESLHQYVYAHNHPVLITDPSGYSFLSFAKTMLNAFKWLSTSSAGKYVVGGAITAVGGVGAFFWALARKDAEKTGKILYTDLVGGNLGQVAATQHEEAARVFLLELQETNRPTVEQVETAAQLYMNYKLLFDHMGSTNLRDKSARAETTFRTLATKIRQDKDVAKDYRDLYYYTSIDQDGLFFFIAEAY